MLGSAAGGNGGGPERAGSGGPGAGELIVGLQPAVRVADAEGSVRSDLPDGSSVVRRNETLGFMGVRLPDRASAQATSSVTTALEKRRDVAYVEPNATYYPLAVQPTDPQFGQQYAPQLVNAPTAWETTLGSADVTIGVVDQGTDYGHSDLQAQFGSNEGRDFVDDDGDPMPASSDESHGTHVSGIAAGTTDNGTGVSGISNSTLVSARSLSLQGGSLGAIADGITWCTDQGADLINMSLGGGGFSTTLQNACQYALDNGALPVAAAGNSGERGVSYPAAFDAVVAVSAVDSNERLADFSQYGPGVEVAAPGVQVRSTVPSDGYQNMSGTSMACPAAVGVAALGLAADPTLTPEELRQLLKDTARDVGLSSEEQGSGVVDAAALVEAVGDGGGGGGGNTAPTASVNASSTTVAVDESVTLDASGSSDQDGSIDGYSWTFGDGTSGSGSAVSHSYSSTGSYTATVTVTDDGGATDSASVTIAVESDGGGGGVDCSQYPEWDAETAYNGGDRAVYDGAVWEAEWWTRGDSPDTGDSVWTHVGDCSGGGGGGDDNTAPDASVSVSSNTVAVGESVSFDASGSSDSDGTVASYSWAFGDGTSGSGATASHSYSSAGEYTVTVTVTDDGGATDSASAAITVESDGGGGGGDCDAPAWDAGTAYGGGDRVAHDGSLWEANWWTRGDEPGSGGQWGPWDEVRSC